VLLIAGDTLFNFDLQPLLNLARSSNDSLATYYEETWERMPKHGMMILQNGYVADFIEKPAQPTTNLAFPSILVLKKSSLPELPKFLAAGGPTDGLGFFVSWLIKNGWKILGYQIPGRYDLGTLADCQKAQQELST
jgi:NDP-sugar pyrophosphorylase family protein